MNAQYLVYILVNIMLSLILYRPVRLLYLSLKLVDTPSWRKINYKPIPLGGGLFILISLLMGVILKIAFFNTLTDNSYIILVGVCVMFVTGTIDDAYDIRPINKFSIQTALIVLTILTLNLTLNNLHGLFGIYAIPPYLSWPLTVMYFLVFLNMFNLSDGIDGLALTLTLVGFIFLSGSLVISNNDSFLLIIYTLLGALVVLLINNFKKDKMYLGDSGSLSLGFLSGAFVLKALTSTSYTLPDINYINFAPIYAMCIFWYPLFDTIRIFTLRLYNKKSPFSPDRGHLHHLLVDRGYSHLFVTTLVAALSICTALLCFYLSKLLSHYFTELTAVNLLFVIMLMICWLMAYFLFVGWPINLLPARNITKT